MQPLSSFLSLVLAKTLDGLHWKEIETEDSNEYDVFQTKCPGVLLRAYFSPTSESLLVEVEKGVMVVHSVDLDSNSSDILKSLRLRLLFGHQLPLIEKATALLQSSPPRSTPLPPLPEPPKEVTDLSVAKLALNTLSPKLLTPGVKEKAEKLIEALGGQDDLLVDNEELPPPADVPPLAQPATGTAKNLDDLGMGEAFSIEFEQAQTPTDRLIDIVGEPREPVDEGEYNDQLGLLLTACEALPHFVNDFTKDERLLWMSCLFCWGRMLQQRIGDDPRLHRIFSRLQVLLVPGAGYIQGAAKNHAPVWGKKWIDDVRAYYNRVVFDMPLQTAPSVNEAEEWKHSEITRGKKVLMLGGVARSEARVRLEEELECTVEWPLVTTKAIDSSVQRIRAGNFAVILLLPLRDSRHGTDRIRRACAESGTLCVVVPRGYGPERVKMAISTTVEGYHAQ